MAVRRSSASRLVEVAELRAGRLVPPHLSACCGGLPALL